MTRFLAVKPLLNSFWGANVLMEIQATQLDGVFLIDLAPIKDERGYFSRTFCQTEFRDAGLVTDFVQQNTSHSRFKGTMRGLHYQLAPHAEVKLLRCTKGSVYDVVVDLRKDSPTYLQSQGFMLTHDNFRQIYVPGGCAHGFLTLEDDTAVSYLASAFYTSDAERGICWNDPIVKLDWPVSIDHVTDKDTNWPDYSEGIHIVEMDMTERKFST